MTELTIRPEDIRDAIARNVESYAPGTTREEVGRVVETGDGIARVEGLHSAMTNELLEFEGGLLGLALNLDVREIGTVLLGDGSRIEEGQAVRRTGEVLSVPVGDGFGETIGSQRVKQTGHVMLADVGVICRRIAGARSNDFPVPLDLAPGRIRDGCDQSFRRKAILVEGDILRIECLDEGVRIADIERFE